MEFILIILVVVTFGMGLYTVTNIYDAIVNYKKPEYYCAKCGKKLSSKAEKCSKCKVRVKE